MKKSDKAAVIDRRMAGDDHAVLTVQGGGARYRKSPCDDCPWRRDAVGKFPPEAFIHSASTAYDVPDQVMLMIESGKEPSVFGCHSSKHSAPATCAGFLMRGAMHNMAMRMRDHGDWESQVSDGGHELFYNYREMAVANGCDPADPALALCRDDAKLGD